MPFIGKQPQVGAYSKLDAITTSATATYNLTLNSGAYYPSSANHLMVSLNGVMQAPQDSFTISGATIIFASTLASTDSIDFIMALGDVLDIGTPSDGTVVTAKIQNAAVTTAKLADDGVTTAKLANAINADIAIGAASEKNTPSWKVKLGSVQSVPHSTWTKILFDTESWDTDSGFASNRFTVPAGKAGKYTLRANGYISGLDTGESFHMQVYKNNGSNFHIYNTVYSGAANSEGWISMTGELDLVATDYVEVFCYHTDTNNNNVNANHTSFSGFRITT
jgi:hypothetical protein